MSFSFVSTRSLQGRLTLTFIAAATLPIAIATTMAVRNSRSSLQQQVGSAQAEIARQTAHWLDRVIYERGLELQTVASNGEIAAAALGLGDTSATRTALINATKRSNLIRSIRVYDAKGALVGSSAGGAEPAVGTSWFKDALADPKAIVIGSVTRESGGTPVLRVSVAVRSATGMTLGVVAGDLDWTSLCQRALSSLEKSGAENGAENGAGLARGFVVDTAGTIIGSTTTDDVLAKKVATPEVLAAIAKRATASIVTQFLNQSALVSFSALESQEKIAGYSGLLGGRAAIVIAQPASAAFAAASSLRTQLLLVAILILAVVGAGASVISRMIAAPIIASANIAEQLSLGNTEQDVGDVHGTEETIRLSNALRELLAYMRGLTRAAEQVAKGDMRVDITPKSEQDQLSRAFVTVAAVNTDLIAELGRVTERAAAGELSSRAHAEAFHGSYHTLVEGINHTLDAVMQPIVEASQVLERVAARDLSQRVQGTYKGDHARITNALNGATENLDRALHEVTAASHRVAASSAQIGSGSEALASQANSQASSLEEISASLQELATMTKQNAEHAQEVRRLASEARTSADAGGQSMTRLSEAMQRIKTSSDATAKIVKTIDEIAFQTNLLALNAAVEAARAGDAGRGFAVVADEVRNLAMRSAEAAKNTAHLIEEAVRDAMRGVQLNEEAQRQLADITDRVGTVGEVIADIAAASHQQSEGVTQITRAVEDMNLTTQHVASSSHESASAAKELESEAQALSEMTGRFVLSGGRPTETSASPAPRLSRRQLAAV